MAERLPLEEARAAIEYYIRRIPRVYRIDWTDLRARISYHREVEGRLRRAVEELGGRVERVVEARPPLRIMYVDFSGARPPPVAVPPHLERYMLWSKFSAALLAAGISPEEHRHEFEAALEETEGLPFEERQRRVEELARRIVETFRPPPPPPPAPPVAREEIERIVREAVREAIAELLPPAPPALPEPGFVLSRCVFCGAPAVVPDQRTLWHLLRILPFPEVYYMACPECRRTRLGWGDLDHMLLASLDHRLPVDPAFWDWLRRVAEAYRRAREAYLGR